MGTAIGKEGLFGANKGEETGVLPDIENLSQF
jgi:hypothetical protein